jgi:hypothetical protein
VPPLGSLLKGALRAGGALGGGYYGASTTDDPGERLLRGAAGAVTGGLLAPAAGGIALRKGAKLGEKIADYTYFSMLSSPDTILRANAGAIGGAINAATELAAQGQFKNAANIIQSLANPFSSTDGVGLYFKALRSNPDDFARLHRETLGTKALEKIEQHQMGRGIGRLFGAPDIVAVNAMKKGGFNAQEAARYTLTGEPQTWAGKRLLGEQRRWREKGGVPGFLAVQSAPFARVGILGLEKGLQRTPGLGMAMNTGASRVQKGIQQALGTGAFGTGLFGEEMGIDPRVGLVAGPLAGPSYLPYIAGRALRQQAERGKSLTDPETWAGAGGQAFRESSPFGFQPFGLFGPSALREGARRLIPAGVADVAAAVDPAYGRETARSAIEGMVQRGEYEGAPTLAPLLSRIPGLRETLPETFAPVDVFGRPRFASPHVIPGVSPESIRQNPLLRGVAKTTFPSMESIAPSAMPQSDPLFAQLRALGLNLQAPSPRVTVPGTGLPLQQTAQSAAATQRMGGIPPQIAAQIVTQIMSRPQMQALPPAQRNWIARQLMDRIRGRVGRAMGSARLATALGSGARLPSLLRQR